MNTLFFIIVGIVLFDFITERILDILNLNNWNPDLPGEAKGIYDEERYRKSMEYYKVNDRFSMITSMFSLALLLSVLFLDGFAWIDHYVRSITVNPAWMALLFFGIIGLASDLFSTLFSLYKIFVIEEKFGFNKMTPKTFVLDKLKGYLLSILIGGALLSLIVWIYGASGKYFWLYALGVLALFMVFATMFYASIILPLFNKLTPLPEGELRTSIESYCGKVGFKLHNLFVMDGSKRSSKANAFFSGMGAKKKIVLFDTLIEKHSTDELVAILAHEVGHYKKKHTMQGLMLGLLQSGIMLFILSLFLGNPELSKALGASQSSFHLDILAFGMIYSPLSALLGILMNMLSRKNEYEADRYAKETSDGTALASALIKLSVDNLGNLKPHPAYVFVHYSHPTLLQRLEKLK
ncbi:MAG: M48 family metallopeptidase [Bacteroidetes bacterium]|nr:M48 family metallopeptidase [Bacteroidota bacterium]